MNSIYTNNGYLRNDDRASGGGLTERDIRTCPHCQKVLQREPGGAYRDADWCGRCAQPVCTPCAAKAVSEGCLPFKKVIDEALTRFEQRRMYSKLLGLEG